MKKMHILTLLTFLLVGSLPFTLQAQEEKVDVKARLPGVDIQYKSNPTPAPQPAPVVEKTTVVKEQEKSGCTCNLNPTTNWEQAILGTAFILIVGLIPRWFRNRKDLLTMGYIKEDL